jgi:hypothetical protein
MRVNALVLSVDSMNLPLGGGFTLSGAIQGEAGGGGQFYRVGLRLGKSW